MSFESIEEGTMTVRGVKLKYRINSGPGFESGYNGYVTFPKRPVRETGYDGILNYVPVYGGITYASPKDDGSMEYGFDTAHYDSMNYPCTDVEWIKSQIKAMAEGILRAVEVEDKYLRCTTNRGKAKHCDYVADGTATDDLGTGAHINLLIGKL